MNKENLTWAYGESMSEFFHKIERLGGWPVNAQSVVMRHGFSPFDCYFSELKEVRDEWNTTRYTSDDYYLWKVSDEAKGKIKDEVRRDLIRSLGGFT